MKKEYACDVCGASRAVEVPFCRKYTGNQPIHICTKCGFVYVKRRRPFDEIAEVWSKKLFGRRYTSKTPLMLARHTYVAEFIDQSLFLRGKVLVDIGAGEGQFLGIARKHYGAKVFGIEPSESNCRIMKKNGIACFRGTLEEFVRQPGLKIKKADIATLMWTLENATSPRDLLSGARLILKDGGHIVVATGSRILVPFAKPLFKYLSRNPADTHPSRFSVNSLCNLLESEGFVPAVVNPYLNDSIALCVIARKGQAYRSARLKRDDYRRVVSFFRRWHKESAYYR